MQLKRKIYPYMRCYMDTDLNFRASYLRAARAWLGIEQGYAAPAADIALNTLIAAEKARACTDKTWRKMRNFYASRGIVLREGEPVLMQIDSAALD